MFCDIKNRLDEPQVSTILAACLFDNSPEGLINAITGFKSKARVHVFGEVENGEIVGVTVFQRHSDAVEILYIAVAEEMRRRGFGGKMINALQEKYRLPIELETDDDAVEFYRKCGFITTAIKKYGLRRWVCERAVDNIEKKISHKGTVKLKTKRLILRKFEIADAEAMYGNWAGDPEVTKYLTWQTHSGVEATKQLLSEWLLEYSKPDHYNWAIVLKTPGEPIGSISVVNVDDRVNYAEIGYCLGQNWWNKGYMTEALTAVIKFLFEQVGANRIAAVHDANNPISGKVMLKCGLKYEGLHRQDGRNNQGICDLAEYAILAEDYFAN